MMGRGQEVALVAVTALVRDDEVLDGVVGMTRPGDEVIHLGASAGRVLFSGKYSMSDLLSRIAKGATIKSTELTRAFDIAAHRERYPDGIILFVTDDNRKLHFPVEDRELPERPGSIVTALVPKAG